jgi:hypothetical protein
MRDHQPASVPGESVFALSAETMLRVKMQPECSGDPCHGIVEVVPRSFRATRRTIPELLVRTAFAAVFLAIAPQLATADSRKADRPNVLLITADDLGYNSASTVTVSCPPHTSTAFPKVACVSKMPTSLQPHAARRVPACSRVFTLTRTAKRAWPTSETP